MRLSYSSSSGLTCAVFSLLVFFCFFLDVFLLLPLFWAAVFESADVPQHAACTLLSLGELGTICTNSEIQACVSPLQIVLFLLSRRNFLGLLVDAGNWMWLAASAFFTAYYRVYSPVSFAKRWSAAPHFIRHYLPVLSKVPDKYICEPWTMPKNVAQEAGVEIGKDYPKPMCNHSKVSAENIARMKESYKHAKEEGTSPDTSSQKKQSQKRPSTHRSSPLKKRSRGSRTYKMSK